MAPQNRFPKTRKKRDSRNLLRGCHFKKTYPRKLAPRTKRRGHISKTETKTLMGPRGADFPEKAQVQKHGKRFFCPFVETTVFFSRGSRSWRFASTVRKRTARKKGVHSPNSRPAEQSETRIVGCPFAKTFVSLRNRFQRKKIPAP